MRPITIEVRGTQASLERVLGLSIDYLLAHPGPDDAYIIKGQRFQLMSIGTSSTICEAYFVELLPVKQP